MKIRAYQNSDYNKLKALYVDSSLYGGQFDVARDSEERIKNKIEADPDAILVAEESEKLVGSVSLIDDGRVAWLFRFVVKDHESSVVEKLCDEAFRILKKRGHKQVLVYAPKASEKLKQRYSQLGFCQGGEYICYWRDT